MPSISECESPAEKQFYPILEYVCKKLDLIFWCQETVEYPCDYYDWIYERYGDPAYIPDWLQAKHTCGPGCRFCNYWKNNELYRIDFVVRKNNTDLQVAIEIDGAAWHNKEDDAIRDYVLSDEYDYHVYRITAMDLYSNPLEVEESLIDFFRMKIKGT